MSLGPSDVSKMVTGPLSPYTVQALRHVRDFMEIVFKLETYRGEEEQEAEGGQKLRLGADKVLLTCVGLGYTNMSKKTA